MSIHRIALAAALALSVVACTPPDKGEQLTATSAAEQDESSTNVTTPSLGAPSTYFDAFVKERARDLSPDFAGGMDRYLAYSADNYDARYPNGLMGRPGPRSATQSARIADYVASLDHDKKSIRWQNAFELAQAFVDRTAWGMRLQSGGVRPDGVTPPDAEAEAQAIGFWRAVYLGESGGITSGAVEHAIDALGEALDADERWRNSHR